MNSKQYLEFKKRAQHSVMVYEKLKDNSFWQDKELVNELFDDTILSEEGNFRFKPKIRIGSNYQVDIPLVRNKSKGKTNH